MNSKDWKQALKEAGCQYMDYIAEVKEEIVRPKISWAYLAVVVYLEKKYKGGLMLRCKVVVEHDLVIRKDRPELYLCSQLTKEIKAMDKEAGADEEA